MSADGGYAIGDVTGHGACNHVSLYQGKIAIRYIVGQGGPAAIEGALATLG